MPGCVLRVQGPKTKVRQFLAGSRLRPVKVYYKGDPGFPRSRGPSKVSGFNVELSRTNLGSSCWKQCAAAVGFMRRHSKDFQRLRKFGFKRAVLDFGLYDQASKKYPWPAYPLSRQLVALAGKFGFDLELSFYGKE
jgi:hypothetical protein